MGNAFVAAEEERNIQVGVSMKKYFKVSWLAGVLFLFIKMCHWKLSMLCVFCDTSSQLTDIFFFQTFFFSVQSQCSSLGLSTYFSTIICVFVSTHFQYLCTCFLGYDPIIKAELVKWFNIQGLQVGCNRRRECSPPKSQPVNAKFK